MIDFFRRMYDGAKASMTPTYVGCDVCALKVEHVATITITYEDEETATVKKKTRYCEHCHGALIALVITQTMEEL